VTNQNFPRPSWAAPLEDAVQRLVDGLTDRNWSEIVCRVRSLGSWGEAEVEVSEAAGTQSVEPPAGVVPALSAVRKKMATPEHGTWFTATLTVRRGVDDSVQYTTAFDYDHRPDWTNEPDVRTYLDDLQRYPRPESEIPDWHPAKRTS
jgi:hypothetical protein